MGPLYSTFTVICIRTPFTCTLLLFYPSLVFPLSLSLSFFRRRDRVISGRRNALLSWVLIFFFFFVVFSNGVFSGFLVIVLSNGFSELQGTCLRSRVCSADFVNFVFVNITGLALSSMIFLEGNIENIFF